MSMEDQVRRELEQAAAQQQIQPAECPVEEDIDVALSVGRKKGGTPVKGRKHWNSPGTTRSGTPKWIGTHSLKSAHGAGKKKKGG
jgi:hypothetical protein